MKNNDIIENFEIISKLGDGLTATVYLANEIDKHKQYVLKVLKPEFPFFEDDFRNEYEILSKLHHPNIIKLYDLKEKNEKNKNQLYFVLEWAKFGDLFSLAQISKGFPDSIARAFFLQILNAVEYLHDNHIIHRDLKLENILLADDFSIRICDFGLSICQDKIFESEKIYVGTKAYMAPEVHQFAKYSGKSIDIFSLGMILFIMVTGRPPFDMAVKSDKIYQYFCKNLLEYFWPPHEKWKLNNNEFTKDFKDLIAHLLSYFPKFRYSIAEIKKHPYITNGHIATVQEIEQFFSSFCESSNTNQINEKTIITEENNINTNLMEIEEDKQKQKIPSTKEILNENEERQRKENGSNGSNGSSPRSGDE